MRRRPPAASAPKTVQAADRDQINPPIPCRHWLHRSLPMERRVWTALTRQSEHSHTPCQSLPICGQCMYVSVPACTSFWGRRTGGRTASWAPQIGKSSPCKIARLHVGSGRGLGRPRPSRRLIVSSPGKVTGFPTLYWLSSNSWLRHQRGQRCMGNRQAPINPTNQ